MKKIFSKLGILITLIFSFLLPCYGGNNIKISAAESIEDIKYGTVDISIDYAFYLRYGISPYKDFNLGSIGRMGDDRYSAFAFNIPEEVEEKITNLEIVNVKYKECKEFNFSKFVNGNLLPLCMSKSDVYTEDSLNVNNNIGIYYSKNYLDYLFKGKRKLSPISQIGLVENLLNYQDKNKLDLLKYADDNISNYKYYAVVENDLIYDEIVISIEFVDTEGEWNIYECNIDKETGMCSVPNLDDSDKKFTYRLYNAVQDIIQQNPLNIIWVVVAIIITLMLIFKLLEKLIIFILDKMSDGFFVLLSYVGEFLLKIIILPFKLLGALFKSMFEKSKSNKKGKK